MARLPCSRQHLVIAVIASCLILQLLISHELWVPVNRSFPLVPAFPFLPLQFGRETGMVLAAGMAVSLLVLIFRPGFAMATWGFLGLAGLLILEDISRLQPWLYLFGLLLLPGLSQKLTQRPGTLLYFYRLVLAGTYCWSGLQKMNLVFGAEILPWLVQPFGLSDFFARNPYYFIFPALFETAAGLLLVFRRTAKTGAAMAVGMHLFLLWVLSPFGQNWNLVVLPWNLAMVVLLYLLVPRRSENKAQAVLVAKPEKLRGKPLFGAVVLLVWVLPALNFFDLWPNHLSGSLYSGNNPEADFYYAEPDRNNLPGSAAPFTYFFPETPEEFIALDAWFFAETKVPFYPETRYFKQAGRKFCKCVKDQENAGIQILETKRFSGKEKLQTFTCAELLQE